MTGHRPPYLFYLCWRYLGPLVMAGVFTFYLVSNNINIYLKYLPIATPGVLLPRHLRHLHLPHLGGSHRAGAVPGEHGLGPPVRPLLLGIQTGKIIYGAVKWSLETKCEKHISTIKSLVPKYHLLKTDLCTYKEFLDLQIYDDEIYGLLRLFVT